MKHPRYFLLLLCLLMLAAIPSAAQEGPLGVPLSPEQAAGLPDAIRSDPRAAYGVIHITGFDSLGCNEYDSVARWVLIVPESDDNYIIRTKLSRSGQVLLNAHILFGDQTGSHTWALSGQTSGGPISAAWPLIPGAGYKLAMLLMTSEGKPLWYTEATFTCDDAPSSAWSTSAPAQVISVNPEFDKAGALSTLAAKWKPAGNAKRNCTLIPGDCAIKMTAKPGKTAQITQNKRFKLNPAASGGDVYGLLIVYDTKETDFVPGEFGLTVKINGGASDVGDGGDTRYDENGGQTLTATIPVTAPLQDGEIFTGLIKERRFATDLTKLNIDLTYNANAKSTVFVRSVYFWVADLGLPETR